jgi:hypothetical protein
MKKTLTTFILTLLLGCTIGAQASPYNQANWYFTLDLEQVRNKIVPLMAERKAAKTQFHLTQHLPTEVLQITAYGHSETEDDLSLILGGDFSGFDVNDYINSLMSLVDAGDNVSMGLFDSYEFNGAVIEQYQVSGENESKSFYSAKINSQMIVLSFEESEVKNWVDNKYNRYELSQSGMVSLLINIESAMAHMGADLSSNSKPFNSAVFQKITQLSASLYEAGDNLVIDSALSTADEATAQQLEQVINGLIAMNALSNLGEDKPILSAVLSGLQISNQGSDLLISTQFALSLISQMDIN